MDSNVKSIAQTLIDSLPDDATWEDIQYLIYVRQQVEAGLADIAAGRLLDKDEVRRRLEQHKQQLGHRP